MDNEKINRLIDQASTFEKAGELASALEVYSKTLDFLVEQAKEYAQLASPAVIEAIVGTGSISMEYLSKFNEYLKKDKTAALVSNNMALVFAKMGNKESARAFFEQAIDLTPKGECYDAPHIGLEMLKNLK